MKKLFAIILGTAVLFTSCKKWVSGHEVSPNAPGEANPALLNSACQLAIFATYGGSLSRTTSMWAQHSEGVSNQSLDQGAYIIDEGDVENEWGVIYQGGLKNMRLLEKTAGDGNPAYQGMAKVMSALMLGVATDMWGDIPWTEALQGEDGNYSAKYDSQESIIAAIQTMLDEAVVLLDKPDNALMPGSDDFIYGGDAGKWKALAYAIKARYAMRVSNRDANWHTKALDYVSKAKAAGFTSSAADANCIFGTNSNEYNQWYAFTQVERGGYMLAGAKLVDLMNSINDPRVGYYFSTNDSGKYKGAPLGSQAVTNISDFGSYYASQSSVTPIATYVELLFIEAEAQFAAGNKAAAATAHNDAIQAHVELVTGSAAPAAYVAAQASETAGTITLEKILTHKYVSGFSMIEPYNDWRRTGVPTLTPSPLASISGIARRYPYSLDERLYNSKFPGAIGVNDLADKKVWWDSK